MVSGLLLRPEAARWLFVLAHGAGAGMRHPFLESIAAELAGEGIATFRYQFPYAERGRRRPDPAPVLLATVRSAIEAAREAAPDLWTLAGGKSMGGRMTSLAAAEKELQGVRGIVLLGFPLQPPAGGSSAKRTEHLFSVRAPMLFVQGTRDRLAEIDRMRSLVAGLSGRATLAVIEGGDHSFRVLERSGRTDAQALREVVEAVARWAKGLAPKGV
jgi:hypothetical protein